MGTPVIQLDIDPAELGRSYPIQVGLQGDAKAALRKMIEAAAPSQPRTEWLTIVQHLVQEWRAEVAPLANSDASPIRPERLCTELTAWLPNKSVLVTDTSNSGIRNGNTVVAKYRNHTIILGA